MSESLVLTKNQRAFLDMVAYSEIGPAMLKLSDNGYNVIVGSTPDKMTLFDSYADHPRKRIMVPQKNGTSIPSTAAGRYQILAKYYDFYAMVLKLSDFSPLSQDKIAMQLVKECRALEEIEAGNIEQAIHLCCSRWASLPGAGYKQHENTQDKLLLAFKTALEKQA